MKKISYFVCISIIFLVVLFHQSIVPGATAQTPPQVGLYKTLELVFQASSNPANPFDTYLLKVELTSPTGRVITIDGFYDGDGNGGQTGNIWKARIAPDETGIWTWQTVAGDAPDSMLSNLSGQFDVIASGDVGGVATNGKYFQLQTGKPVYLVGNFLDFVGGLRSTHTFMSETTTDAQRNSIITRQRDFHTANKANIYFANKGDYGNQSVTPWVGTSGSNDKTKMDLAKWKLYDGYIRRFKDSNMFAEMWFFADDSGFGSIPEVDRLRLIRYALARTSGFSHTMYVLMLEWSEAFGTNTTPVNSMGTYFQQHNPWGRTLSVHNHKDWWFSGQSWPGFIATQAGNGSSATQVNKLASDVWNGAIDSISGDSYPPLPHIDEEYGHLNSNSDTLMRNKVWANFAGGAAGGGTGSDLKALQRFILQSRIPFQRMGPNNSRASSGGGSSKFILEEVDHQYLVYSTTGTVNLTGISGNNLQGYWFDPRNPNATMGSPFLVPASTGSQTFTPPSATTSDWVLWITDGTNLIQNPVTHPSSGATITQVQVNTSLPTSAPTATPTVTPTPNPLISPSPTPTPTSTGPIFLDNLTWDSAQYDVNGNERYSLVFYGLNVGADQYTDRTFTFSAVPATPVSLVGQTYIMTANDDKGWNLDATQDDFLRFDLFENATVYVGHDDRLARPSWLSSFVDSGLDITSGGGTYSLFQKAYSAGDTVRLGINGGGGSMYTVAIVPLLSETPTPTPVPGDTNNDTHVTVADLSAILANFGLSSGAITSDGDVNGDGKVNLSDLVILLANFGT